MATAQTLVAGRYRLQQQLGAGGMGLVWRARDEVLGRDVAIKEVVPPVGLSEVDRAELRLRTLREARTAARLNHPNVVKIYDVVHTEEWPWIVMEYVPSRSLHDVISGDGPLRPPQVARIGLAVLAALTAAHQAGVLHRDVKPGNVLIADDGRVVLTDFGLATFEDADGVLTMPGLVLGSAQYVAPERARDGTSTPQTDLWSLGATLYAAVEGRSPYARSTTLATLTALATALPDPPQRAGPLKPVLNGLLRRNPKDRMTPAVAGRALIRVATQNGTGRRRIPGQRGGRLAAGTGPTDPALPVTLGDRGTRDRAGPDEAWPDRATPGRVAPDQAGADRTAVITPGSGGAGAAGPGGHRRDRRRVAHHRIRWPVGYRRERWLVLGALMAVLLGGLGTLMVRSAPGREAAVAARTPVGAAGPTTAPVLGTTACASTTRPRPVASIAARPGWDALLPGFVWYLDPAGFRISVPYGWAMTSGPDGVCFREPGDTRALAVQEFPPDGDPVAHWRRQEAQLDHTGRPRSYTDLGINTVSYYFEGSAEWEYTYLDVNGTAEHGLSRCVIVSPQHAFTIAWRTRAFDWQPDLDQYRAIIASFHPAG